VVRFLSDYGAFLREFLRTFHTTGAILPSGPWLASALVRYMRAPAADGTRRILEVGPGTGAVTRRIVAAMRPAVRLDLVELYDRFVECLRDRFRDEPQFRAVADRVRIFHCSVEELPAGEPYDLVISGLPLNNFAADQVERILGLLTRLLRPGGTLSFFQYIAIRQARAIVSGPAERERLRGIGRALAGVLQQGEIRRDWVWPNVPPAWVHHVRVRT